MPLEEADDGPPSEGLLSSARALVSGGADSADSPVPSIPELGKLPRLAVMMRSSICDARNCGFAGGLLWWGRESWRGGGFPGDWRMTDVGTEVGTGCVTGGDATATETAGAVGVGVEEGGGVAGGRAVMVSDEVDCKTTEDEVEGGGVAGSSSICSLRGPGTGGGRAGLRGLALRKF